MNRDVCEHFNPVDLPCDKCKPANVQKSTLREAAQQALEALEYDNPAGRTATITALRAALAEPVQAPHMYPLQSERMRIDPVTGDVSIGTPSAEPVQEPVAWRFQSAVGGWAYGSEPPLGSKYPAYPLYTAPPQRKPLTEEEIINIGKAARAVEGSHILPVTFARAIEQAHGIGGQND